MEGSMVGVIGFVILLILIFIKLPIAFAFGIVGFLGVVYLNSFEAALTLLKYTMWSTVTSYTLLAIPLFVLMGQFTSASGAGKGLYDAASKWFGRIPGGLSIGTIWASAGFAACSGSSAAGVLTFGPIAYEPMVKNNYSKHLAMGTILCGSTMGSVIPPSITFLVYAGLTEESVGKLFMAGVIPGLIEAVLYSATIVLMVKTGMSTAPPGEFTSWKEKFISLKGAWGALALFLLIMGGIYGGLFTPTEASGMGAAGGLLLIIAKKRFSWAVLKASLEECLFIACVLFTAIVGAQLFSRFIALSGLSRAINDSVMTSGLAPIGIMAITLGAFFVLGTVMPTIAMMILSVPLLYPLFVDVYGFSGIWFGVLVVVMSEVAQITPPVGGNLFALKVYLKDEPMLDIYKSTIPFIFADILRIVLILLFPALCLWLPGAMMK